MLVKDDKLFQEFIYGRKLKQSTQDVYGIKLTAYSELIGMTPSELIQEAEEEEDDGIRLRKRKIKTYFQRYHEWLTEQDYSKEHIRLAMGVIRTFYNEYDIILPKRRIKSSFDGLVSDKGKLPTIDDIRQALKFSNMKYRAIILTMLSSGMGRGEIISLKLQDFINGVFN
jgi:integrase